jgi:hypothetical protein
MIISSNSVPQHPLLTLVDFLIDYANATILTFRALSNVSYMK